MRKWLALLAIALLLSGVSFPTSLIPLEMSPSLKIK